MKHSTLETIEFIGKWIIFILLYLFISWSTEPREVVDEDGNVHKKWEVTVDAPLYNEY